MKIMSTDVEGMALLAGFWMLPLRKRIACREAFEQRVRALTEQREAQMTIWVALYQTALDSAAANGLTLYSSRIDGAVLPW